MLNRAEPPKAYSPSFKSYTFPKEVNISENISLFVFNEGDQKVFKIELLFSAGSISDSNPVLASFCVPMLREGSLNKSGAEISNILDYYGAFLEFKTGLDNSSIALYGRSEYLEELIAIIFELVTEPAFPAEMIQKHKEKLKQNLRISERKTAYWAPRLLRQSIFGEASSYGKLVNENSIDKIIRSNLFSFHENTLIPSLKNIVVAGSFNEVKAINLIQNSFGDLGGSSLELSYSSSKKVKSNTIEKQLKNTSQASLALGKPILSINDPDYPTSAFLVKVLGGFFGSRLMKKLREDEGLTYGIHAYNVHLIGGSYLQISADVKSGSTDKSIDLIFKEIEKLQNKEIMVEELNTVKNYMLGEYINDSNSVFDFAELHRKVLTHNLPGNFFESFYNSISTVEAGSVLDYANKILKQGEFSIVKVV